MQVYRELRILTARPTPADEARVAHRLFGVLAATEVCSAVRWRDMALAEIAGALGDGKRPIVVGGTGLYLRTLMHGIAAVPGIPDAVRARGRALFERLGSAAFHRLLAERDQIMAARLGPGDSQRLVRAWEVVEATGRSLAEWQRGRPAAPALDFRVVALMPPREILYAACDARVHTMIDDGALAEACRLDRLRLDPALPVMKAVGLREFLTHLRGEIPLAMAVALAQQATRRYAKRQMTWLRHQVRPDIATEAQYSSSFIHDIVNKIS